MNNDNSFCHSFVALLCFNQVWPRWLYTHAPERPPALAPSTSTARLAESLSKKQRFIFEEGKIKLHGPRTPFICDLKNDDGHYDALRELEEQKTVLYLAYGSNLAAETFRGKRGIRPISQVNVAVPSLKLTFDLPGIPYAEPCFANTAIRQSETTAQWPFHLTEDRTEGLHDKDGTVPLAPDILRSNSPIPSTDTRQPELPWCKSLVGVVYELTLSDYAHVIATEGAGSSYEDLLVLCHPLEPGCSSVPTNPTTPPFKAHTLFAPAAHGDLSSSSGSSYAQPSLRYLTLIRTGAQENKLPREYKAYLESLHDFKITTRKQQLGRFIFLSIWTPVLTFLFQSLMTMFADSRTGEIPKWLKILVQAIFSVVWTSYTWVFKPLFGNGERTIGE